MNHYIKFSVKDQKFATFKHAKKDIDVKNAIIIRGNDALNSSKTETCIVLKNFNSGLTYY